LVNICSRESRHEHGASGLPSKIEAVGGPHMPAYYKLFKSMGGSGGIPAHIVKNPPDSTVGQYSKSLVVGFHKGAFSGGYGGHKWGVVAECLDNFVHGVYSAEMMMDVGWTLCHNGGPIFNKGMQYTGYNHNELNMILDCQRSGQIPQLLASGKLKVDVPQELTHLYGRCCALIPGFAGEGYVDWHKVKADGGLHNWTQFQLEQDSSHGTPMNPGKAYSSPKKESSVGVTYEQWKPKSDAEMYTILPGLTVEKLKNHRKEVAA